MNIFEFLYLHPLISQIKRCKLMIKRTLIALFSVALVASAFAQKKEDKKWDVSNPTGGFNLKEVAFKTDEGTWMNLDVSPDGKTMTLLNDRAEYKKK